MKIKFLIVGFLAFIAQGASADENTKELPDSCVAFQKLTKEEVAGMEFFEIQKMKSACIRDDALNSFALAYDSMIEEDPIEEGCLSQLKTIDVSILAYDPNSLLEGLYSSLMDQITNFSCDAVVSKVNKMTSEIDVEVLLPGGLGSMGVSQGMSASSVKDLLDIDVKLTNEEIQSNLNDSIWNGEVPKTNRFTPTKDRMSKAMNPANDKIYEAPRSYDNSRKVRLTLKDITFGSGEDKKKEGENQ